MNRETESHFANIPDIGISRSKFDRSFTHKTTFDTGELIPIYCDTTIMPGDTVKMRMSEIVRMSTPIAPVMDNCNLDLYFFYVPYRLIWSHFREFMGENTSAPWTQTTTYTIPQVKNYGTSNVTSKTFAAKSLADYFGYPVGTTTDWEASILPFRAYCLVWNEFFRDENLQNPVNIALTDATQEVRSYKSSNYNDTQYAQTGGGRPLKVCKYHDYFTSALPGAQKGPAVAIPLGDKAFLKWGTNTLDGTIGSITYSDQAIIHDADFLVEAYGGSATPTLKMVGNNGTQDYVYGADLRTASSSDAHQFNVYADLSQAVGATVNQLRQAFAIQKFYERQARGGTRYIEMVKSHFNVTNPDFRLQRPEYLGGKRIPINMNQVIQSTQVQGSGQTPLGTTGAYSVTSDRDDMFTHSFTEHGILLGLACVRTTHTYQQGLNRQYSKKNLTDFYFPEFANLGEQAILNKEIFLQGYNPGGGQDADIDEQAFGYQEAWATERYFPDIVTGEFRSNYTSPLDIWHYADYYTALPSLGDTWIKETDTNVARTLAVQNHSQFIADFYFGAIYTRPMPLYSIPGLIDHH